MPSRKMAPYSTSKAGVVQLSRCLRADLRDHGIGVSVVCPGMTNTPIKDAMRVRGDARNGLDTLKRIWKYSPGPDAVARAVTTAGAKNRALVTTGIDATLGYQLMRIAPESAKQLLARTW
jgi:NAD(P)-dependent dehydrogenase (short-subunit alcohol dehydrogenase family)